MSKTFDSPTKVTHMINALEKRGLVPRDKGNLDYLETPQLQPFRLRTGPMSDQKRRQTITSPGKDAMASFRQEKLMASRTYYMSTIHH